MLARAIEQAVIGTLATGGVCGPMAGFSVEQACLVAEPFLMLASSFPMPVADIDGRKMADGRARPHARTLRRPYIEASAARR